MMSRLSRVFHNALESTRLVQTSSRVIAVCISAGALTACVQSSRHMYDWQSYQPSVYTYLNGEDIDYATQAQGLEQNVEAARSTNAALPPGFRAHLGLLYLKMGEDNKAVEQLEGEKLAFPESTLFMDFLMRNASSASTTRQATEPTWGESAPQRRTAAPTITKNEEAKG